MDGICKKNNTQTYVRTTIYVWPLSLVRCSLYLLLEKTPLHFTLCIFPSLRHPNVCYAQEGQNLSTLFLFLSRYRSLNHKLACLYIMLISVLHTSFRYLDWIGLDLFFMCFFLSSFRHWIYMYFVCECVSVCFFPHYFFF